MQENSTNQLALYVQPDDLLVTSNLLVDTNIEVTINEIKIIYLAMVAARNMKSFDSNVYVKVHSKNFAELTGQKEESAKKVMLRAIETLKGRSVEFEEKNLNNPKRDSITVVPVLSGIRYFKDEHALDLRFTPEVIPHFTKLVNGNFTVNKIGYLMKLDSLYAMEFYRFLRKENFKDKVLILTLEQIRIFFNVVGKYDDIKDLKARVIDIAVDQINAHTDIMVNYENVRTGRKVTGLKFDFAEKPKQLTNENSAGSGKVAGSSPNQELQDFINTGINQANYKIIKPALTDFDNRKNQVEGLKYLYEIAKRAKVSADLLIYRLSLEVTKDKNVIFNYNTLVGYAFNLANEQ